MQSFIAYCFRNTSYWPNSMTPGSRFQVYEGVSALEEHTVARLNDRIVILFAGRRAEQACESLVARGTVL